MHSLQTGLTPLMEASAQGHVEAIKALLAAGASLTVTSTVRLPTNTLARAARWGNAIGSTWQVQALQLSDVYAINGDSGFGLVYRQAIPSIFGGETQTDMHYAHNPVIALAMSSSNLLK